MSYRDSSVGVGELESRGTRVSPHTPALRFGPRSAEPTNYIIPLQNRVRSARAAIHASGVIASDPSASAVQTKSKPNLSANFTRSRGMRNFAPGYPRDNPSFMDPVWLVANPSTKRH
jgi:hypothetical protein